jgi:glutathione S-transferase
MQHPPITLRYFDARSRAQFLRYYFKARKVSFTDDRVPVNDEFAAWRAMRDDRARTGPFHKLPVLHWGDRLLAETLMIAAFIHEASGDAGSLNDDDNLRHGMLTSSLCLDMMNPIAILLWLEINYQGADVGAVAKRTLDRLKGHCQALEQAFNDWRWLDKLRNRRIMLADCLLWEELDVARVVFGPHWSLSSTPTLARFYDDFPGRGICEAALAERPCPVTARPNEAEGIAKIQQALGG